MITSPQQQANRRQAGSIPIDGGFSVFIPIAADFSLFALIVANTLKLQDKAAFFHYLLRCDVIGKADSRHF